MNELRDQVIGLNQMIHGKKLIYFDWAATGFAPQVVVEAVSNAMTLNHGTVRRGVHTIGTRATQIYEEAREQLANFIGGNASEFIFTSGTTQGLNLVANCAGGQLGAGDVVVLSQIEHHSQLLPWQRMAKKEGFQIKMINLDSNGRLSLRHLRQLLAEGSVRVIAFPMISNVLGTIQPIIEVAELAKEYNAYMVLDGAQALGHYPIDVQKLGVGAIAFGAHKMYGPAGIGGLWVHSEWLSTWEPYMVGGGMIQDVSFDEARFFPAPYRFEAGTPNIAGAVGMVAAADWLENIGWGNIIGIENQLREYLSEKLERLSGIHLLCKNPDIPIFSFIVDGIHAHDIGTALDFEGIAVRAGHHCTQPFHDAIGVDASTRVSLCFLNTIEECDSFIDSLQRVITYFREL